MHQAQVQVGLWQVQVQVGLWQVQVHFGWTVAGAGAAKAGLWLVTSGPAWQVHGWSWCPSLLLQPTAIV